MKVLVTDAENKNALAAIRSLGLRGVSVLAGSSRRLARGFHSRYRAGRLRYPSPHREEEFIAAVLDAARADRLDVVLPIGDACNRVLSKHLPELAAQVAVPVAPWRSMQIASSKRLAIRFAQDAGIEVPLTFAHKAEVAEFPVVVKRSIGAGGVRYVNNRAELEAIDASDAVIQEWIPGEGYGFFALFDHGRECALFMHRRLREYPVTGGASTAAESIREPELAELGLTLLRKLEWHGAAMVEFKRDIRDGRYKLMEINAKFWGSLDLAIAAGVDFPWLTTQLALGRFAGPPPPYEVGVRYRWVFDDVMHVAARPSALPAFLGDFRDARVHHDVWRSDLAPTCFDAARTVAILLTRSARGTLRRPHGSPVMPREHANR
jgi:predicted ATP-grasp superfamily ATP-dependent carboligase